LDAHDVVDLGCAEQVGTSGNVDRMPDDALHGALELGEPRFTVAKAHEDVGDADELRAVLGPEAASRRPALFARDRPEDPDDVQPRPERAGTRWDDPGRERIRRVGDDLRDFDGRADPKP